MSGKPPQGMRELQCPYRQSEVFCVDQKTWASLCFQMLMFVFHDIIHFQFIFSLVGNLLLPVFW